MSNGIPMNNFMEVAGRQEGQHGKRQGGREGRQACKKMHGHGMAWHMAKRYEAGMAVAWQMAYGKVLKLDYARCSDLDPN